MVMTKREAGRIGAAARHNKSKEEESAIAKKAAATRLKKNPSAFKDMGKLGGSRSHSHVKEQQDRD
jgi:general stress protein YciG